MEVTQLTAALQSYDIVYKKTNLKAKYDFCIGWEQKTFPDCGTFAAVILLSLTLPASPPEEILKEGGMPALIRKGISKAPWQEQ